MFNHELVPNPVALLIILWGLQLTTSALMKGNTGYSKATSSRGKFMSVHTEQAVYKENFLFPLPSVAVTGKINSFKKREETSTSQFSSSSNCKSFTASNRRNSRP